MRMVFRFHRIHFVMFVRHLVMSIVIVIALEKEQRITVKETAGVVSEERSRIEHH